MGKKSGQKQASKATTSNKAGQYNDISVDDDGDKEEILIKCNACLTAKPEGISRCNRCRTRAYCSRECQKNDWKMHKLYCRPRLPSKTEFIEELHHLCEQNNIDFRKVKQLAKDPTQHASLEKAIGKIVKKRALKFGHGAIKNIAWPPFPEDWKLDDDSVWNKLKSLPLDLDSYILSYMTLGRMDRETGFLVYYFTVCSERTGKIRLTLMKNNGRPMKQDLEMLVYWTLMHPMPGGGKPARPIFILLANRWGEENSREVVSLLREKVGVDCHLESREESLLSAHQNNTDPDGYNFRNN